MFLEYFSSGPAATHCILLGCSKTKRAAVIDLPFEASVKVLAIAKRLHLTIDRILLTHSHWDHIAEVALLQKELGVPVYIHPEDEPNLRSPGADGLPLLKPITPARADHFLSDGQKMVLGELMIEVFHTPGHSPGSVCFYLPKEGVLLAGDTLFKGSIGNISFPTSSPEKMWRSLEKLAKLPPNTRVISGHGSETTIGAESWLPNAQEYFG